MKTRTKILASLGCCIPFTVCGYAIHEILTMAEVAWWVRPFILVLTVVCAVSWGKLLISIWKGTK